MDRYENRPCTVDVICYCGDEVLLIQRMHEPYEHQWALPGGYVDAENALDAAVRELNEETGMVVNWSNLNLLGVYSDYDRDPRHTISIVYYVEIGIIPKNFKFGSDAEDAGWWKFDRLPKLAFDHDHMLYDFLKKLFNKNKI